MNRRTFLKLVGMAAVALSLPAAPLPVVETWSADLFVGAFNDAYRIYGDKKAVFDSSDCAVFAVDTNVMTEVSA